jgi:hypothetical protein
MGAKEHEFCCRRNNNPALNLNRCAEWIKITMMITIRKLAADSVLQSPAAALA